MLLLLVLLCADPKPNVPTEAEITEWVKKDYLKYIRSDIKPDDAIGKLAKEYGRHPQVIVKILGKDKPAFVDYRPKKRKQETEKEPDKETKEDDELNLFPVELHGETKVQFYRQHDRFKKETLYYSTDRFEHFEILTSLNVLSNGETVLRIRVNGGMPPEFLADNEPVRYAASNAEEMVIAFSKSQKVEIRVDGKEFTLTPDSMDSFKVLVELRTSQVKRNKVDKMFAELEEPEKGIPMCLITRGIKDIRNSNR